MLGMHMGRVAAPNRREEEGGRRRDTCDWLQRINRACVAANTEAGLLSPALAGKIVAALDAMKAEAEAPGAVRPELYITFEPEMLKRAGMEASVLHVGRSSQDILATANAGLNMDRLVRIHEALLEVDEALLGAAVRERGAVVPAYTNGVQAQPTLYAHYLLAQHQVFGRDMTRVLECLNRFDVCPMGSGVLNGTGWPLPVERLAELLGFARAQTNAFDVGQCSGNDLPLEIAQIVTSAMLHVNAFIADFMMQYAQPRPWIRLDDANGVYRSSAMPQKRNPGLVNDCRRDAGLVIGGAQGVLMRMQNLTLGMADVRDVRVMEALADDACVTLRTFAGIVRSLRVDRERALEELNSDWTCTQELADRMGRLGGMDFRSAHKFASHLVTRARAEGWPSADFTYGLASRIWDEWAASGETPTAVPQAFPLNEASFLGALDPVGILEARATTGSANPKMVDDALTAARYAHGSARDRIRPYVERWDAADAKIEAAIREALAR